ncbi:hypothetical protein [Sodalis sp. RH22]|uniref:hypothetical protein n=1 Tax=unclassified Sodalis (in: enterobacteria) TaxID=2636512 RepID=UPI0039B5FAA0
MAAGQYDKLRRAGVHFFNAYPYPVQVGCYVIGSKVEEKICWVAGIEPATGKGRCTSYRGDGMNLVLIGVVANLDEYNDTLCHECYHAMNAIYNWMGSKHDLINDEPGAYFLGYLVRYCNIEFARMPEIIELKAGVNKA